MRVQGNERASAFLEAAMILTDLQHVANTMVQRAQRRGYVIPKDIREELGKVGLPETHWKEVVSLAGSALYYRQGRYYYVNTVSPRLRAQLNQQGEVQQTIRRLIRLHKQKSGKVERRSQDRIDFIQPVTVRTEDGRAYRLLSRDLSNNGIRLIGTRSLLGQKIHVEIHEPLETPAVFLVRILWTCAIGDDLFENGGAFLEVIPAETAPLNGVNGRG
jgi:PilZ domain